MVDICINMYMYIYKTIQLAHLFTATVHFIYISYGHQFFSNSLLLFIHSQSKIQFIYQNT